MSTQQPTHKMKLRLAAAECLKKDVHFSWLLTEQDMKYKKLSNPWGNYRKSTRRVKRHVKKNDKIGWNHAYNKLADMYSKAKVVKRKWKNPKAYYGNNKNKAMNRKRYYK